MGRKRKAGEALETSARDLLEQWNEYYTSTDFGIGIQCSQCQKWRLTYQYQESKDVPVDWNCSMWLKSEKKTGNCSIPSNLTEEDFAQEEYPPGTVVWAKLPGFNWWPAMIEDSPDTQEFFVSSENGVEEYHVTYFGKTPKRSWIRASHICEFDKLPPGTPNKPPSSTLKKSIALAKEAAKLPIKERLKKYSFAERYKGRWAKLNVEDDVSLPPTCKRLKKLAKPVDVKSPATNNNRPVNENDLPRIRKRASESEKKVDIIDLVSEDEKLLPVDEKFQQSSGDCRVQTAKTTDIIRRDAIGLIRYRSYQFNGYPRKDSSFKSINNGHRNEDNSTKSVNDGRGNEDNSTKSVNAGRGNEDNSTKSVDDGRGNEDNSTKSINDGRGNKDRNKPIHDGRGNEENRPEEDDSCADDEDSEDNDREQEVGGARILCIPAPPLVDLEDSTISEYSSDEENMSPVYRAYKEYAINKYRSFLEKMVTKN